MIKKRKMKNNCKFEYFLFSLDLGLTGEWITIKKLYEHPIKNEGVTEEVLRNRISKNNKTLIQCLVNPVRVHRTYKERDELIKQPKEKKIAKGFYEFVSLMKSMPVFDHEPSNRGKYNEYK